MICCSNCLYSKPTGYTTKNNRWLNIFTSVDCPRVATVFTSLLNTICTYNPYNFVPYSNSLMTDYREPLVDSSLQALLALLDFKPAGIELSEDKVDISKNFVKAITKSSKQNNLYLQLLSNIHQTADMHFIYNGIATLLNNVHESVNTYLPNSTKKIECHQEILTLLWKLLDCNSVFLTYILQFEDISKIVLPIAHIMATGRNSPSSLGEIHICTFILLLLSGKRGFGVALNKSCLNASSVLNTFALFEGNHADLLVQVFHKIIVNGSKKLKILHSCLLTIISNISAYTKSLSKVSSMKLLGLFEIFSSSVFLFRLSGAHQYLFFLVDTFNNIIQYQYQGNLHILYLTIFFSNIFPKYI
eukprot:GSMAST32.ASY1.ANO1.218.1 assembled CDS